MPMEVERERATPIDEQATRPADHRSEMLVAQRTREQPRRAT
jgi:hypothetical protein